MKKLTYTLLLLVFISLAMFSCRNTKNIVLLNSKYKDIIVKDDCKCVDKDTNFQYAPQLKRLIDYNEFKNSTEWKLKNTYDSIFYDGFYANNNHFSLVVISQQSPVKIMSPNKTFSLNLTPCPFMEDFYKVKTHIHVFEKEHRIDNDEFDYTAKAYFNYLISGSSSIDRIEPKKVLKNILDDKVIYGYSGEDFSELEKYITGIYERYGISYKKSKYRETIIENFISTLDSVDVDITDFILSEFVLTKNSVHKINKEEKRNLEKIFYQNLPFDWITFTIKNSRYNGGFITDKIGIEINENIIRKWNTVSQKPVIDSTGLNRKTDIVLYINKKPHGYLSFSNFKTFRAKIDSVCITPGEIAGTGILLNFNNANLIFPQKNILKNSRYSPRVNFSNYPLFEKNHHKTEKDNNTHHVQHKYDTLLTNFSGLQVPEANIKVPFGKKMLLVKGRDLIVNNYLISGVLVVKCQFPENESGKIRILSEKTSIKMSIDELKNHFKGLGIDDVIIEKRIDKINIYFKKVIYT